MAEYNSSGTLTARYLHGTGPDEPLAQIAGTRRWFLADTQGSIIAETDTGGALVGSAITYDPYGQPASWTGPRFGYTGQMRLVPSVPLWHYKARAYDPRIGRFLQTDPIGYVDSLNLYAYVGNDPVNLADPTGMMMCPEQPCPVITVDPAFGDDAAAVQNAVEAVQSTERYQAIQGENFTNPIARELGPIDTVRIVPGTRGTNSVMQMGPEGRSVTIEILTRQREIVQTTSGPVVASLRAVLGHEIPHHMTGIGDTGPDRMDNIRANENPMRIEWGEPERTSATILAIQLCENILCQ